MGRCDDSSLTPSFGLVFASVTHDDVVTKSAIESLLIWEHCVRTFFVKANFWCGFCDKQHDGKKKEIPRCVATSFVRIRKHSPIIMSIRDDNDVPLGRPPLRVWDLDQLPDADRYDRLVAGPSDDGLRIMWIGTSTAAFTVFAFASLVFVGMIVCRDCRRNPFNVYLVYLMLPDIVAGILCGATCAMNAAKGEYWSSGMCRFQSAYLVWNLSANSCLSAVVAYQLHRLLASSHVRRRYFAPTHARVHLQSWSVYAYAASWAALSLWEHARLPYEQAAWSGEICLPTEYSRASTVFYFLAHVPLSVGIPVLYVMGVTVDIVRRNLLPPAGKRRLLVVYFCRILGGFFLLWTPYLLTGWLAQGRPWALWVTSLWGHGQGAISAALTLWKPDVYKGFCLVLTCGKRSDGVLCCRGNPHSDADSEKKAQTSGSGGITTISGVPVTDNTESTRAKASKVADDYNIPEQDSAFQFRDEQARSNDGPTAKPRVVMDP